MSCQALDVLFGFLEAKKRQRGEMLVLCRMLKQMHVIFLPLAYPSLYCTQLLAKLEWPPMSTGTDIIMASKALTDLPAPY